MRTSSRSKRWRCSKWPCRVTISIQSGELPGKADLRQETFAELQRIVVADAVHAQPRHQRFVGTVLRHGEQGNVVQAFEIAIRPGAPYRPQRRCLLHLLVDESLVAAGARVTLAIPAEPGRPELTREKSGELEVVEIDALGVRMRHAQLAGGEVAGDEERRFRIAVG